MTATETSKGDGKGTNTDKREALRADEALLFLNVDLPPAEILRSLLRR